MDSIPIFVLLLVAFGVVQAGVWDVNIRPKVLARKIFGPYAKGQRNIAYNQHIYYPDHPLYGRAHNNKEDKTEKGFKDDKEEAVKDGLNLTYEAVYQGKTGFIKLKRDNRKQVQITFGPGKLSHRKDQTQRTSKSDKGKKCHQREFTRPNTM